MTYKPFRREETRSSVLAAVRNSGDEAGWARFFDVYAGFVYSIARQAGLQEVDADEIVQSVFTGLAAQDGFGGYEREKGRFRVWLARRVAWRIKDFLRQRAAASLRRESLPPEQLDTFPSQVALDELWAENAKAEAMRRLREAVSPKHVDIFQASALEDLPSESVCALYQITRDNLYQIRRRVGALFSRILRETMEELDHSPPCPQKQTPPRLEEGL